MSHDVESVAPRRLGEVSIVVPVGPGDGAWRRLLPDLAGAGREILVSATEPEPADFEEAKRVVAPTPLSWIEGPRGRGRQLNAGASRATGNWLWFVHADSRIDSAAVSRLEARLEDDPDALLYFDLAFRSDGPTLMPLNAVGTWCRSRWLGMPFGDQGFCLARSLFMDLGQFDEQARYGEDHLLVWAAHRRRVAVRPVGAVISTSARKYGERGWMKTTVRHVWLTYAQAVPQAWLWLRGR